MHCVDIRPARQLWLPILGDVFMSEHVAENPVSEEQLMECVLERGNMLAALRRVERNDGAPGVDGMKVEELRGYLKIHWSAIRELLLSGEYRPQPVRRVEIPKPAGGTRELGIPVAVDRLIQQALLQVLQSMWDATFAASSFGFRPGRSAHQALAQAQEYFRAGYRWVVDIDLEKFFDRVSHDKLMGEVQKRVSDRRILRVIRAYLESGVLVNDTFCETMEGTCQGGPLSPLLANVLLDLLDRELARRGHRSARYADDCNIYVRSRRAGWRVMRSITRFLSLKLKLRVNESKSAVDRPWKRKFLGFSFTRWLTLRVSREAIKLFKERVRKISNRTRGWRIEQIVEELGRYMTGWRAYYGIAGTRSVFRELESWIKRRLRCYLWKQWGRSGYRELISRGVSRDLAWNTSKSAHGPWRLSRSPALAFALTARHFASLGLPRLVQAN